MWRDSETGTVVKLHDEIRALRPLKTLPAILTDEIIAEEGFDKVESTQPQFNSATQRVDGEDAPVEVDGKWEQRWRIVDMTPDEIAAARKQAIDSGWEQIKAEREANQNSGVEVNGKWFQTDQNSRIQYLSLMMLGSNIPPGIQWKTMDNSFVPMTQELVTQIFNAAVVKDQTIFATAEQHHQGIINAENPAEYNFHTGWPVGYTGDMPPDTPTTPV